MLLACSVQWGAEYQRVWCREATMSMRRRTNGKRERSVRDRKAPGTDPGHRKDARIERKGAFRRRDGTKQKAREWTCGRRMPRRKGTDSWRRPQPIQVMGVCEGEQHTMESEGWRREQSDSGTVNRRNSGAMLCMRMDRVIEGRRNGSSAARMLLWVGVWELVEF